MKKKNSDIINEVKRSVEPKNKKKAGENELPADLKDKDLIKLTIEEWIEKNARKITKDILQKEIKNLFK